MKQTKTTLKELTAAYRAVLRHGILCNAIALGLIAVVPARAETITYSDYNGSQGALAIIDGSEHIGGEALVFEDNTSSSHGAGLYYKVTDDGLSSSVILDAGSITFNNNASNSNTSSGGALFNSGGDVSVLGDTNVFTNNHISGVDGTKPFKRGGGAIANQSYETESNSEPKVALDATMVIGKLDGTSENTFSNNTSSMNGGAIMNRALDTDGNATLTINGTTTFDSNTAAMNGGAIYNVQRDGRTAQLNLNNGEYTFTGNQASGTSDYWGRGGAIYNSGVMNVSNATFGGADAALGNTAEQGGAIYNAGNATVSGAFENNSAQYGGAVLNAGTLTINGDFGSNSSTKSGGAIYNAGTVTVNGTFENNSSLYGGAIINAGTATVTESTFSLNEATDGAAIYIQGNTTITDSSFSSNEAQRVGGALSVAGDGLIAISGTSFTSNSTTNGEETNSDGGAIGQFDGSAATINISNSTFTSNTANNVGGAVTSDRALNVTGSHFIGNQMNGTWMGTTLDDSNEGGGAIFLYDQSVATITDTEFTGNHSGTWGGAISTRGVRDTGTAGSTSTLSITGSTFAENTATVGGAIANSLNSATITDTNFTDNTASDKGGAIYNKGTLTIAANEADVTFTGNTANGEANDIYNIGTLTLNAADGHSISLAGGVDGLGGTLDIVGGGLVDISNSLDNQDVTVYAGQLHLSDPMTLTNSTINVEAGAALNTLDNAINNYASQVNLGHNSSVFVDANADGIDTFSIASGNSVNVEGFKMLSDLTTDSAVRHLANAGYIGVSPDLKAYTTAYGYTLTGNSADDGTVTITRAGTGGLSAAAGATNPGTHSIVNYALTDNDTSVNSAVAIQNADFVLTGAGIADGDAGITLADVLTIEDSSELEVLNAKFNGDGAIENAGGDLSLSGSKVDVDIANEGVVGMFGTTLVAGNTFENREGATALVFDSVIDANVLNYGRWISDPTTYSGEFENAGAATFDADTFTSTAILNNSGTADLTNGVTFDNGATITNNGVINLVNGTTHFNNTESSNTINLANGADFDGVLTGTGILNTANGVLDTVTGGVAGGSLIVDASLKGAGTIDTFTGGTTGAKVKTINILNSEYGDAESLSLNIGGATLDEDLQINGMNYYTSVTTDGEGNLVFSDKLINRSTLDAELADYAELAADNTFIGLNTFQNADGINIKNADASIGANLKVDAVDAEHNALYVDGVDGVVAGAFVSTDGGFMTDHFTAEDEKIKLTNASDETMFKVKNDGTMELAGIATLGGLNMGGVTVVGIDTTVANNSNKLVTSGAVYTALGNKQNTITDTATIAADGTGFSVVDGSITTDKLANQNVSQFTNNAGYQNATQVSDAITDALANGGNAYQTASDVESTLSGYSTTSQMNDAISDALNDYSTTSQMNTAISDALSGYSTTEQMNTAIADNAQNATYTAGGHDAGTIGAAIDDINTALGHASDTENGVSATGLFADVESNTAAIAELTGTGANSISGQIAASTTMADDGDDSTSLYSNFADGASVKDAVAGLDSAIGTTSDGTHVAASNNVGTNINALDTALAAVESNIGTTNTGTHVVTTNNVGQNINALDSALATAEENIATLQGDESTDGSVRNIAKGYVDAALALNTAEMASRDALTLNQANAYTDERIEKLDKDLSAGIASAVALSSVAVSDVRRGELSVGAGYGYFNGQSAGAFGAAMGISNRWSVNAGAGVSGYDVSFRAGTNYKFKLF